LIECTLLEKYEKQPSAPENENVESECQVNSILHNEKANHEVTTEPTHDTVDNKAFNAKVRQKLMEQSSLIPDIKEPSKDGLRLRKGGEAGSLH